MTVFACLACAHHGHWRVGLPGNGQSADGRRCVLAVSTPPRAYALAADPSDRWCSHGTTPPPLWPWPPHRPFFPPFPHTPKRGRRRHKNDGRHSSRPKSAGWILGISHTVADESLSCAGKPRRQTRRQPGRRSTRGTPRGPHGHSGGGGGARRRGPPPRQAARAWKLQSPRGRVHPPGPLCLFGFLRLFWFFVSLALAPSVLKVPFFPGGKGSWHCCATLGRVRPLWSRPRA